jgi:hypothetical protein
MPNCEHVNALDQFHAGAVILATTKAKDLLYRSCSPHPYREGEQLTTGGMPEYISHAKVMIILDSLLTGAVASTCSNCARGVRVRTISF